jgi:transporter family protein
MGSLDLKSWQFFAFGSAFFAGLTALLGKIGVQGVDSDLATLIRTIVILGLTTIMVSLRSGWSKTDGLSLHSVSFLILSGIATGLSWLCYYRALQLGPASRVAPVDKLGVAFAIVLAVVFLGERLTWQTATGGALVVAGSFIIAFA